MANKRTHVDGFPTQDSGRSLVNRVRGQNWEQFEVIWPDMTKSSVPAGQPSPVENPIDQNPAFLITALDGDPIVSPDDEFIVAPIMGQRIVMDTPSIVWDFTVPGQARAAVV